MSCPVLLRRSPSRQGLETLLRLTTQWHVEDEEEAARERRRRERDKQLLALGEDRHSQAQEPERPEQETLLSLKTSEAPEPDEDEGFSDWSQKAEQQQPRWAPGDPWGGREAPGGECPGEQEEGAVTRDHVLELEDSEGLGQVNVPLDTLHLSPELEPQDGPGPGEPEPEGPGDAAQGQLEPAEAGEAYEEHQKCQQSKTPSLLVLEGAAEQSPPPLSPTTKLADRTESLSRCIEKSNSARKSQTALPISKIDERLEQYTQAIETAGRTPKLARQTSIELPSMAVASTKSLWETGEVQAQAAARTPSCKDIVAGDMSKRSLWEQKGSSKPSPTVKSTPTGKRYKFVATGHGKYEKVLTEEVPTP
ncbi:lymphocyte-specific protein 1 isoform X2 [Tamandua tetradactyla]|uniref:lymphocyte-specific protein 1 isoform X2 n=1 Tax=Tamandua tetradactyla TaxID=48850 RepID=UPI00405445F5